MLHAFPDPQSKITLCPMPCALCLLKGVNAGAHAAAFMLECLPFLARISHEFTPWRDCGPVYGRACPPRLSEQARPYTWSRDINS
jgi:hypothetical protein